MQVEMREGESFEKMLARFKTGMTRSGILKDYKRHSVYMSPSEKRRRKAQEAARRARKVRRRSQDGYRRSS